MSVFGDIRALVTGMWITWSHMFRKAETIEYPEEKQIPPPRYRGRIILTRDPDGEERCVACYLCSGACPVDCIAMQSAEREDGRRYPAWFRINFARCIYCGLCAEACPTMAIQMTTDYEFCKRTPLDFVYEKDQLLIDGTGKDPHYNFYREAGVGVTQNRGEGKQEQPPVDPRGLLP